MRLIKKHLSLWRLVLIISVAAIAIPIAAGVRATAIAGVNERSEQLDQQSAYENENLDVKHSKANKAVVGYGVRRMQDDYYDRRREHWEKRLENRLDSEEYLDDDDDGEDAEDSKDKKDSKADKDDGDDEGDAHEDEIERRRDYWRQRLDREW